MSLISSIIDRCSDNSVQNLPDVPPADLQSAYRSAADHVRSSRLTDAELVYTPSQIGLAAFSLAAPDLASLWIKFKGAESMMPIIENIKEAIIKDGAGPNVEIMRDVDRRLRLCKNPEKIVGSQAYLAKKAEEETKAKQKRARKAEKVKRALEEGDPFGEELDSQISVDVPMDNDDDDDDDDDDD